MNKNVGKIDRVLRIVAGLVIIGFGIVNNSWLGLIGFIPLATAIIGWCPAYLPFNLSTCSKEECSKK